MEWSEWLAIPGLMYIMVYAPVVSFGILIKHLWRKKVSIGWMLWVAAIWLFLMISAWMYLLTLENVTP